MHSSLLAPLKTPLALLLLATLPACEQREEPPAVVHEPPAAKGDSQNTAEAEEAHASARAPEHNVEKSAGQRLYVPVYSSVYLSKGSANEENARLANRLQIRNVSESKRLTLRRVDLYNKAGAKLETVIAGPVVVKPLETRSYMVTDDDNRAGPGGSFVVEWVADDPLAPPIVETVNGYVQTHRAFAFVGEARVIAELDGSAS